MAVVTVDFRSQKFGGAGFAGSQLFGCELLAAVSQHTGSLTNDGRICLRARGCLCSAQVPLVLNGPGV